MVALYDNNPSPSREKIISMSKEPVKNISIMAPGILEMMSKSAFLRM